ncbi:MAG TPA: hypothetical protein VI566_09605 [Xanthomonadales bacterium]|nr:hypothetical protein [Xanthomonadales bacterium]
MKIINQTLLCVAIGGSLISAAGADQSTAEKFSSCRAEAEVVYGNASEPASVRLEGVRKAGTRLLLRVYTPEGEGLNVYCDVDKKTGELVVLSASGKLNPPPLLSDNRPD